MEVISGAPPAEYGDKTSLVIDVTTRSGPGRDARRTAAVTADYGSFGSVNGGFNLAYGGEKWGNFISANGLNSGRFLDPPEFTVMHDKGNEENVFDRVDYQLSTADSIHLNLRLHAFLVSDAEFVRLAESPRRGPEWWSITADSIPMATSSGPPISARRFRPSTSRPPGRG